MVANACWAADGLLYIQPSVPEDKTLESVTISKGTQFTINNTLYEIANDYTLYYYDGEYHNVPKVQGTEVTINAIDSRTMFGNNVHQLYFVTNTTGVTTTWANWDNVATVKLNGTTDVVANACWAADGLLYIQPSVPTGVTLESVTISKGTQFTINSTVYVITDNYTLYYYNGGYHNVPKVQGTAVTINAIDSRTTFGNNAHQLYFATNTTGVATTWANWDNVATVKLNGTTDVVANACWAADGLLYIQPSVPTGVNLESVTISKGTQFTINSTVYEITEGYTVYYYDGGYHDTAQIVQRSIPLALSEIQQFTMKISEQKDK